MREEAQDQHFGQAARLRVLCTPPHAKAWKEMERESEKRREREEKGVKGRRERGGKRKMESGEVEISSSPHTHQPTCLHSLSTTHISTYPTSVS